MMAEHIATTLLAIILATSNIYARSPQCKDFGIKGEILPKDMPTKFPGENVFLACSYSVTNSSLNSSGILEIYSVNENRQRYRIEPVAMETNNLAKIRDTIKTEVVQAGIKVLDYTCEYHWKEDYCVIENRFYEIDNRPQTPVSSSCLIDDWNIMICTWNLGTKYNHKKNMEFRVQWKANNSNSWKPCPNSSLDLEKKSIACTWKNFNFGTVYFFHVNIIQKKRSINISYMNQVISDNKIVKPAKLSNFIATPNKTSIHLTWKNSNNRTDILYRIRKKSQWDDKKWTEILLNGTKRFDYTILDARPDTLYNIKMDIVPATDGRPVGKWSDIAQVEIKTLEDVPANVPTILPFCYSCSDLICNNITIYWKPIKRDERNGLIQNYRIILNDLMANTSQQFLENNGNLTSYSMAINSSHTNEILVSQSTKEGFPNKKDARLLIFPVQIRPKTQKIVVVTDGTQVTIFKKFKDHKTEMFIIAWCKRTLINQCKNAISYKFLTGIFSNYSFTLPNGHYNDYQFGISSTRAVYPELSDRTDYSHDFIYSPITWSDCTYVYGAVASKPLRPKIQRSTNDEEYLVWKPYSCSESRGYVTGYVVKCCEKSSKITCSLTVVSSDVKRYRLHNLKAGTAYNISVTPTFGDLPGIPSEELEWMVAAPFKPEKASYALIVILLTVAFVICLIVIFGVYRLWKYYQRQSEELGEINVPDTNMIAFKHVELTDDDHDETGFNKQQERNIIDNNNTHCDNSSRKKESLNKISYQPDQCSSNNIKNSSGNMSTCNKNTDLENSNSEVKEMCSPHQIIHQEAEESPNAISNRSDKENCNDSADISDCNDSERSHVYIRVNDVYYHHSNTPKKEIPNTYISDEEVTNWNNSGNESSPHSETNMIATFKHVKLTDDDHDETDFNKQQERNIIDNNNTHCDNSRRKKESLNNISYQPDQCSSNSIKNSSGNMSSCNKNTDLENSNSEVKEMFSPHQIIHQEAEESPNAISNRSDKENCNESAVISDCNDSERSHVYIRVNDVYYHHSNTPKKEIPNTYISDEEVTNWNNSGNESSPHSENKSLKDGQHFKSEKEAMLGKHLNNIQDECLSSKTPLLQTGYVTLPP